MSNKRTDDFEAGTEDFVESSDSTSESSPSTKLERRRRIEDLFEEKRLREELSIFEE